jgi:membrane protein implicated in regulation of membrane protease activity
MLPPPFQEMKSQARLITPRRLGTTALRITIAGVIAYVLSAEAPWVMTIWYVYVSFNILTLLGFWLLSRYVRKKIERMGAPFAPFAQEEDLGDAEIVEDAQIED